MATIHRTLAEQEVTFRYDQAERVAWFGTTTRWVARRWQRARYPVRVRVDGQPASWGVKLRWDGHRRTWLRVLGLSLPHTGAGRRDRPGEPRRSRTNGTRAWGGAGAGSSGERAVTSGPAVAEM